MQEQIVSLYAKGVAYLDKRWEQVTFRGQLFEVLTFQYKCVTTGQFFTTPETEAFNNQLLFNQYRSRNNIMFPEQIKGLREQYGLPAGRMAQILTLGVNQYAGYERGELPSLSNAALMKAARNPTIFREMVESRREELEPEEYRKLQERIKLLHNQPTSRYYPQFGEQQSSPDEYTGYRVPNLEKFASMVVYFYQNVADLFKTKLNKLLFYADFGHFKHYGYSISGCRYCAIPMGPVPDQYNALLCLLAEQGYLEDITVEIGDKTVDAYRPMRPFDPTIFADSERAILAGVITSLSRLTTGQVIELSHKEAGWIDNQAGCHQISYQQYGFALKAV